MELSALAEEKDSVAKSFDPEKAKFMKEVEDLKSKIEGIQASKEAAEKAWRDNNAEVDRLRAELATIRISMSQLQASYDRLDAKHSRLNEEKNSVQKALDIEKVEACKLKSKIEDLEKHNAVKAGETEKLKATLEEKKSEIDALNKGIEQLHLAVAEAQEKNKSSILSCLSSYRSK
jgi:predicted nuclease with TOPRIM domain